MDTSTDVRAETCEIVVLGAGMAGLMAATTLSDRDVVVLEGAPRAGGRVESVRRGDYWINLGTQFTEGTGPLIEALKRHKITMGTLAGKTVALALDGKQVDTSNGIVRRHPRVVPFWAPGRSTASTTWSTEVGAMPEKVRRPWPESRGGIFRALQVPRHSRELELDLSSSPNCTEANDEYEGQYRTPERGPERVW